ncbi:MAG: tRNA preQ1(34) S-adenosylmethionine ribosyltransferase-isomerase QueA [Candidatus Omnitrophica bacterium]|nr:tRNA preQ1(34) S-adenosylmethionine ribosyltransferase-isomerase QueA [Candidatus Omnitrophota bacterium]
MRLSDFDYNLPAELIAQYPLKERSQARLLVLDRKTGKTEDSVFRDLGRYLQPQDLLVLNDTKVLPARLIGQRSSGGKVEVLLLSQGAGFEFSCLIRPNRLKLGERINFNSGKICAELTDRNKIRFFAEDLSQIYSHGVMPLPPYIKRKVTHEDSADYQTVYARNDGSIASPTAGLHFTGRLLGKIKDAGVNIAYVTLHISYSTFKPVKSEDISRHKMEPEYFEISPESEGLIKNARARGWRIIAVGTTSLRVLETYAQGKSQGHTDLFIYPGYEFKMAHCLLTNFHLPKTTLFMLACAFAGEGLLKRAYQEAIDKKYRFYSYGDAMLII